MKSDDLIRELGWVNAQFNKARKFAQKQTLAWERVLKLEVFFDSLGYDLDLVVDQVKSSTPKTVPQLMKIEPFSDLNIDEINTILPILKSETNLRIFR